MIPETRAPAVASAPAVGGSSRPRADAAVPEATRRRGIAAFVVFSVWLLSPNLVACFMLPAAQGSSHVQVFGVSIALWALWTALCRRLFLACAIATPLLLLALLEIYLLVEYRTPMLPHVYAMIGDTNWVEAREFLRGSVLPAVLAVGGVVALAGWALYLLWRAKLQWRQRPRLLVIAALAVAGVGLHLMYEAQEAAGKGLQPAPDEFRLKPVPLFVEILRDTFPFGIPLRYAYYLEASERVDQVRAHLANFKFGASQVVRPDARQVYVLVIGESARFDRWSVNGYGRLTSPLLAAEPHLVAFTDVVSVAPNSRQAIPALLTRKRGDQVSEFAFPERSLISAFKEAGFETYWVSNQLPIGRQDAPISVYAREADHLHFMNMSAFTTNTPFDGILLAPFKRILASQEQRQLIVLHTLGSHANYRQRYPDEFDKFRPSPAPDQPVSFRDKAQAEQLGNAYDNSILYTDWFLSEVIAALRASDRPVSAMLYVSDHGEDLADAGCGGNTGHGRPTRANYRVPMFLWYSDAYLGRFPERVAVARSNRQAPLTSETVFPTLLSAADLHFPTENLERSALSARLKPWKRNVGTFTGILDFDHARLNDRCELVD